MDAYRPGKRVGRVSWAARAGSGDIIGWTHLPPPDKEAPKAGPPQVPRPIVTQPPPASPPSSYDIQSPVIIRSNDYAAVSNSAVPFESGSPPRSGLAGSPAEAAQAAQPTGEFLPLTAAARAAMFPTSPPGVALLHGFEQYDRPGSAGFASKYSLRGAYEAMTALPDGPDQSMDVFSTASPRLQRSESAAVIAAALADRSDFLRVMHSRLFEIRVARQVLLTGGPAAVLSHIGRLGNLPVVVDVLHALAGVGLPKWPQHADVDWLAELTPVLVALLQSDYEEYVLRCNQL